MHIKYFIIDIDKEKNARGTYNTKSKWNSEDFDELMVGTSQYRIPLIDIEFK
jgi:hypothetical protein